MPLTDYLLQAQLAQWFGDVAPAVPATVYVALSQTTPTQAKGTSAPFWNFVEPSAQATLTTALVSGTAYTSLAVTALGTAVASGDSILLTSGANTQTFTASAAAAVGATAISVTSLAANFAYPVGTLVQDATTAPGYARVAVTNNTTNWVAPGTTPAFGGAMDNGTAVTFPTSTGSWGTVTEFGVYDAIGGGNLLGFGSLTAQTATIATATGTAAITSLSTTALTVAVSAGASVLVVSGANSQVFVASAAAAVGATSIAIDSAIPVISFPVGSTVTVPEPQTVAASATLSFGVAALSIAQQ
jgi:hypothetical protein